MAYQNRISITITAKDEASAVLAAASAQAEEQQTALAAAAKESAAEQAKANEQVATSTTASMDEASAAVKEYGDTVEATAAKTVAATDEMSGASNKTAVSAAAGGISNKLGLWATATAAGVAVAAGLMVKSAGDFQASMTRLVTSAGESKSNLQMVSNGVLQVARDTGTSTTALAQAMYMIESGGQHGAAGLNVLKAAAQGAKTENADLVTVADAVTSAMTDYHLSAAQAANVTSKLVAATGQGKTTFQDLAGAMSSILPVASAAHIPLNEILGDLASMTLHGISAQQSAQNLADSIRHLQAPTMQMSKEMAALGLNSTELSQNLGTKGLFGTLQQISGAIQSQMGTGSTAVILNMENALKGLPPAVQDAAQAVINGTESYHDWLQAIASLPVTERSQAEAFATLYNGMHTIGTEQMSGAKVMQTYAGAMSKATGDAAGLKVALMLTGENSQNTTTAINAVSSATADAAGNVRGLNDIQGNFNQKINDLKESLQTTGIAIGTALLPPLTTLASDLSAVLGPVAEFVANNKTLSAGIMLTVGGVAAFVAITWAAQKATNAISTSFTTATGLVKKLAEAMGLLDAAEDAGGFGKIGGAAKEAAAGSELASSALGDTAVAGEATAGALGDVGIAGEAIATGGLLATLGPIALGIGAVGLAAYATYKIIEHYRDSQAKLGDATTGTIQSETLLGIAEDDLKNKTNAVKQATDNLKSTRATEKSDDQQTIGLKQQVAMAQSNVNAALSKFGQNSPQYISAVETLTDKTNDYNSKLLTDWGDTVNVQEASDALAKSRSNLANSTSQLTNLEKILKTGLDSEVTTIAQFGPTATLQVKGIAVLQNALSTVVTTYKNFTGQLQAQLPQQGQLLQGLGSTIGKLQGQSTTLNTSLQHAGISLQGGSGSLQGSGSALQAHALGTGYAPGGPTNLAEGGAELVLDPTTQNLPSGSQVLSSSETMAMLGGSRSKGVFISNLNIYNNVDAGMVAREIGWQLANA